MTVLRDLLVSLLGQQFKTLVLAKQCVEECGSIVTLNHEVRKKRSSKNTLTVKMFLNLVMTEKSSPSKRLPFPQKSVLKT